MILTKLVLSHFRNIESLEISPHRSLNLITGDNGAGKSTILEAIQCLSTGHSFRTRKSRELIKREQPAFTLTAVFQDPIQDREHRAGLSRQRDGSVELRLDYEEVRSIADLTRLLPVKSLTPDSHKLIQEGPDERRQFMDWGLFHTELSYFGHWKQFRRSLLQRNQALRDFAPDDEVLSWNDLLAESAEQISNYRAIYVEKLSEKLYKRLNMLEVSFPVKLGYRPGWSNERSLSEWLRDNLDSHRRFKTTTEGPHRAELTMISEKVPVKQHLSRGQQKILVYMLHLAQLDLLAETTDARAIMLCDDLTSELDNAHASRLIDQLVAMEGQIFVSGVDLDVLKIHPHTGYLMRRGVLENSV